MMVKLEQAAVIVAVFLLSCASALYEDQIKKFDWRLEQIGAVRRANLDLNAMQPRLLVTTRHNVLASLCPKSGEIVWRQVLEEGSRGDLKYLHVSSNNPSDTAPAHLNGKHGFDILTVQGSAPAVVRGWNSLTGYAEWEWSLMPLQNEKAEVAFWIYSNTMLYHVLPTWQSHLEVTPYFAKTGQTPGSTTKISASWINEESCVVSGVYFVCLQGKQLLCLDLTDNDAKVFTKYLDFIPNGKIQSLEGSNGIVIIDKKLVNVKEDIQICSNLESNNFLLTTYKQQQIILQADVIDNILHIKATDLLTCQDLDEFSQSLSYPNDYGKPSLVSFDCKSTKKQDGKTCFYVLSTEDEAIILLQQSKIRWVREEALSDVIAAEFIDLPLADSEGTLEKEIKGQDDDIISAFTRRISSQILYMKSIFLHVVGLGPPPSDTQKAGLVRDSFGLHKMLVLLTKSGKVFGIDNLSRKVHWQLYLPKIRNFANGEPMRLIIQRTSKHFPLSALCTIVAKHEITGNGVLYRFNPITGKAAEGGLIETDFQVKQLALLAENEHDFIKGVLIIDSFDKIHVFPEYTKPMADAMYLYVADKNSATLKGYYIKHNEASKELVALPVWNINLGGHSKDHQIIALAAKNPIERVHSQGRVLNDRSVLYKYINPNLIVVVTQAFDNIHKNILNMYLVDVVSGSVVFSMLHRRVRAPVHIVHSENWLAYCYYNEKVRRNEITTVELYEGKNQANGSVWSSLNAPPMPLVERQSYIIPTVIQTMRETITERGITNKHVLIGTSAGSILEMPWAFLDPRRPVSSTSQGREEGAIPYIPELPMPTENMINYNQTIKRLHNIYTAPSGLESTCLVVATGLDIFVTRVAPSKTFDLLKEDFDYMLIAIVLAALTSGSLIVKHLASKKLLKQAWK